ncbi:MAG: hypothetical protein ACJAZH_000362 [Roseivirga sp.]
MAERGTRNNNFFSSYTYLNPSGTIHLPALKRKSQQGFTLLNTDYYDNLYKSGDLYTANRLMPFNKGMNLKYDIAVTGLDGDKYIEELEIGQDGSLYLIGFESGQRCFYTFGMISTSGSHPWFSKFLNREKETASKVRISTYPNSSSRNFTIEWLGAQNGEAKLLDLKGQVLPRINLTQGIGILNTAGHLPNGMYLIGLSSSEGEVRTQKYPKIFKPPICLQKGY